MATEPRHPLAVREPSYKDVEYVVLGHERCYDCGAPLIVPAPDDPWWCLCSGCGALWQVRDGSISVKHHAAQGQERAVTGAKDG